MKFISKNANLRVVLKPGVPAEPITGRTAISGVYIKFQNGEVNVESKELCEKLMKHPGFNSDFILVEENQKDPYASIRSEVEPAHQMVEMNYGAPGKVSGSPVKVKLSNAQKEIAMSLAKEMAKEMVKNILTDMAKNKEENSGSEQDSEPKMSKKATSKSTKK